jgi:hypothetical protein
MDMFLGGILAHRAEAAAMYLSTFDEETDDLKVLAAQLGVLPQEEIPFAALRDIVLLWMIHLDDYQGKLH